MIGAPLKYAIDVTVISQMRQGRPLYNHNPNTFRSKAYLTRNRGAIMGGSPGFGPCPFRCSLDDGIVLDAFSQ